MVVSAVLGAPPPAPAQVPPPAGTTFRYDWYSGGSPVAGSISVAPGGTFTLDVYFLQSGGTPGFLTTEGGLTIAEARASYSNPGVISVATVSDILPNLGPPPNSFNSPTDTNATRVTNANFAQFTVYSDLSYGVTPDMAGKILMGSFKFTAATNPMFTSTLLTASDIPGATNLITFSAGDYTYALDSAVSSDVLTVNIIVPIPEPAMTLGLAGAAAIGLVRHRRRRPETAV